MVIGSNIAIVALNMIVG